MIKKEIQKMKKNTMLNTKILNNICNESSHGNILTGELQKEINLLSLKTDEGNFVYKQLFVK